MFTVARVFYSRRPKDNPVPATDALSRSHGNRVFSAHIVTVESTHAVAVIHRKQRHIHFPSQYSYTVQTSRSRIILVTIYDMCDTSNTFKHRWDRDKISARPATNKTGALCPYNDSKDGYQPEPARLRALIAMVHLRLAAPRRPGHNKKEPMDN